MIPPIPAMRAFDALPSVGTLGIAIAVADLQLPGVAHSVVGVRFLDLPKRAGMFSPLGIKIPGRMVSEPSSALRTGQCTKRENRSNKVRTSPSVCRSERETATQIFISDGSQRQSEFLVVQRRCKVVDAGWPIPVSYTHLSSER